MSDRPRHRFRWVGIFAVLFVLWLGSEIWGSKRVTPPDNVTTFNEFMAWRPQADKFYVMTENGSDYLIAYGGNAGLLPSGASAYVFDRSGQMIDWARDSGDNYRFQSRWQAREVWESRERVDPAEVQRLVLRYAPFVGNVTSSHTQSLVVLITG